MHTTKKYFSRYKKPLTEMPSLVESQFTSFNWLIETGIGEVLKEFSPIKDYGEKKFELSFTDFELTRPKFDDNYAKVNKLSYEGQIKVKVKLKNKCLMP
jgi:DNA-directed RNA polymerase subunit beta